MAKIAHLTTVHHSEDNRILFRECVSLARAGHDVTILAAQGRAGMVHGVRVVVLAVGGGRLRRMTIGAARLLRAARSLCADVYHFHDPELIPAALVLRAGGKPVIYDVHEDYGTAVLEREYIPAGLRRLVSRALCLLETGATRWFRVVLAERYYAERFPRGVTVLNYARFPQVTDEALAQRSVGSGIRLLYTGNVKVYRGAHQHVDLLKALPEASLHLVGRCSQELADQVRVRAAAAAPRLLLEGVGYSVPFERIVECYLQEQWTAALALFPPSPHTVRKELTKIFEYMAYAIPIVCSAFPNLRRIVEQEGCGLCVDPEDPAAAAAAVRWLADHPQQARAMGRRGREAARREYNWETQARRLLDLYEEVLRESAS